MYVEGEIPTLSTNSNNGGFGNGWEGLIGLALVAGLFDGGFGIGGRSGNGGVGDNYVLATDFATIERKIDGVNAGICDSTFALNNTINNGFFGVDRAVCTLGYQNQQGFSGLASQIAQCCCDLKQINLENRYLNEKQTCDILQNQNANTQRIIDYLTNKENQNLRDENFALRLSASQSKQNAYLLNELRPQAIPAYTVPNPNCCYNPCGCSGNNFGGFSVQ